MEILVQLIESIPGGYRLPVAIVLAALYFGYPAIRDVRSKRLFWERLRQQLEVKKLIYEIELLKRRENLDHIDDLTLAEIEREMQRPKGLASPPDHRTRFFYGFAGAFGAALLLMTVLLLEGEFELKEYPLALLLHATISLLAGLTALETRTSRRILIVLFGIGAWLVIAVLVGVILTSVIPE